MLLSNNYLFCVTSGTVNVLHSFISQNGALSRLTTIRTSQNNSFISIATCVHQFFQSFHCNTFTFVPKTTYEGTKNTQKPSFFKGIGWVLVLMEK